MVATSLTTLGHFQKELVMNLAAGMNAFIFPHARRIHMQCHEKVAEFNERIMVKEQTKEPLCGSFSAIYYTGGNQHQ